MGAADFSTLFADQRFTDPTDPYQLALVSAGLKPGHCLYAVDHDKSRPGGKLETQGRQNMEELLKRLKLPFAVVESVETVDPAYGDGELQFATYFVAETEDWLGNYTDMFTADMACTTLGAFEGFPECCVDTYCTEYNNPRQYAQELHNYTAAHTVEDDEMTAVAALPELSHYPCDPGCEAAVKRGKQHLDFFDTRYPEAFDFYQEVAENRIEALNDVTE